jgi:hypothetical protein
MTGIVIGLLVVTTLSLALRNTLWIGFLGVFLLCNLYPHQSVAAVVILGLGYLIFRYRRRRSEP